MPVRKTPKKFFLRKAYYLPVASAILAVLLFAVLDTPYTVQAQTLQPKSPSIGQTNTNKTSGIVISPFLSEAKILANEATKNIHINLTNNTGSKQEFNITALDFGSLQDTGGLVFAGDTADKLTRKYGLANWLRLPQESLSLEAGQTVILTATIVNEATFGPGGHYAAIIMSVKNSSGDDGATVTVQQKISALIFATKVGGEIYDLRLEKILPDGNWRQLPKNISLRFKNTGNVHVVPRGTVKLIAPGGSVISKGIINEASSYVLPESSRQLIVQTESVGSMGWSPGTYKVQVDYRYDGYEQFASKSLTIKYYNIIGLTAFMIFLFAILYGAYKYWRLRHSPGRNTD